MSRRSPPSDSDSPHIGCLDALSRRLNSDKGTTQAGNGPSTGICAKSESSPTVADYSGEAAGKTAHYVLRLVSTGGEKGPWSETASATIGA
ncbi:MAG: hypothetical protein JXL80_16360 [Planctomycetes bacterium]|nr:hypothetical protein [Planctomycetota bacterium]